MTPQTELEWQIERSTRRALLRRAAQLSGAGVLGAAALGAAPGIASARDDAADRSGTIVMMNYPGWMGKTTVADFKKATGVSVKQVAGLTSGVSAAVAQIAQNKDSYD